MLSRITECLQKIPQIIASTPKATWQAITTVGVSVIAGLGGVFAAHKTISGQRGHRTIGTPIHDDDFDLSKELRYDQMRNKV